MKNRVPRARGAAVVFIALLAAASCDFWDGDDDGPFRLHVEDAELEIFADLLPSPDPHDPVRARVTLFLENRSGRDVDVEIDRAAVRLAADGRQVLAFDMAPDGWSGNLDPWESRRRDWVKDETLVDPETPCGTMVYARLRIVVKSASWPDRGEVLDSFVVDTDPVGFGCAF